MIIQHKDWVKYITDLRVVQDTATALMQDFLDKNADPDGLWNDQRTRRAVLDYGVQVASKYGLAAAELSCEMYDAVAAASGVHLPSAEPAAVATYAETAKAINGTMKTTERSDVIAASVGRLVKMTGVDTTMKNGIRDHAEWAWIPTGETCPFCITLASQGWLPASKDQLSGGHADHIHPHCDCTFAIRHNYETTYEGYDPQKYYDMYNDAGTESTGMIDGHYQSNSTSKINAMRREQYKEKHTKIRAQQNEAYRIREGEDQ